MARERASTAVWGRAYSDTSPAISSWRLYIGTVQTMTILQLAAFGLVAHWSANWHLGVMGWVLVGLGVPIIGIIASAAARSWTVALSAAFLIPVGLGAVSGVALAHLGAKIEYAAAATLGTTIVMSFIGITYRKSLEHWGGYLFAGLVGLLLVRFMEMYVLSTGGHWHAPLIEYLAVALFSGYIIYDWNRAMRVPWTMKNAVDVSIALFLDIVNMFMIFLNIFVGDSD